MVAAELDVAIGAEHQQAARGELPGGEAEQEERGLVGPVEVVEHDHQWAVACGGEQQAGHGVEEAEAGLLAVGTRRRLDVELLGDLGDQLGDLGRPAAELPRQCDGVRVPGVGADRLHPRPVGRCALVLAAAAPVNPGAAHAGVGSQFLRRARLADPRLAHQQLQRPAAGEGAVDGLAQALELALATDEDAARQALEWIRLAGLDRVVGLLLQRGEDLLARLGGVRRTVLRPLGEQRHHGPVERLGDLRVVPGGRHRVGVQVLADDRDRVVSGEGRLAGEHLVEQGAERVEVAAGAGGLAERLLGRQVGHRADEGAAAHSGPGLRRGQAEIAEPGAPVVVDPDVRRLQVAVDDAARVGVLERAGDVRRDLDRPLDLEVTAGRGEQALDVAARHVAADDERIAVVLAGVEDGDHVRVVAELAHRIGLAARPRLD